MTFNGQTTRATGERAAALLQALAAELGCTVEYRGGSFESANCTIKLQFASIDATGQVQTPEATDFKRYAATYGFAPEDLGRSFPYRGRSYTITGLKPRRRNSLCVKRDDGKEFTMAESVVAELLKLRAARVRALNAPVVSVEDFEGK